MSSMSPAAPPKQLGYADITSSQTGITSTAGVDVTNLTLTPIITNRPVAVRAKLAHIVITAGLTVGAVPKFVFALLYENAVIIDRAYAVVNGVNTASGMATLVLEAPHRTPAAGTGTVYKVVFGVQTGTTADVVAAAQDLSTISVDEHA